MRTMAILIGGPINIELRVLTVDREMPCVTITEMPEPPRWYAEASVTDTLKVIKHNYNRTSSVVGDLAVYLHDSLPQVAADAAVHTAMLSRQPG